MSYLPNSITDLVSDFHHTHLDHAILPKNLEDKDILSDLFTCLLDNLEIPHDVEHGFLWVRTEDALLVRGLINLYLSNLKDSIQYRAKYDPEYPKHVLVSYFTYSVIEADSLTCKVSKVNGKTGNTWDIKHSGKLYRYQGKIKNRSTYRDLDGNFKYLENLTYYWVYNN